MKNTQHLLMIPFEWDFLINLGLMMAGVYACILFIRFMAKRECFHCNENLTYHKDEDNKPICIICSENKNIKNYKDKN